VYYVLAEDPDPYPPAIDKYLNKIAPMIGTDLNWTEVNFDVYQNFLNTGESIISRPFIRFSLPSCIS
jgi:hypothetical protein